MAFEVLETIKNAEKAAKEAISSAESAAKQMIADAEGAGKAAVAAAFERADRELAELKKRSDGKAVKDANSLSDSVEAKKAALRVKAENKIDKAASLVVERIVNS